MGPSVVVFYKFIKKNWIPLEIVTSNGGESPTCEYRYLLLFDVVLDDKVSDFLTTVNVSFAEISIWHLAFKKFKKIFLQ